MSARNVPHILKLSAQEQQAFVDSFDVVMCDCDGVMWMVAAPLPGTGEAVNALKANGKRVFFVTNYSARSDEDLVKKFQGIGVKDFKLNDVMHPIRAMLYYIKKHNIRQPVFSLSSPEGNEKLRKEGMDVRTLVANEDLNPLSLIAITEPKQKMGAVLFDLNYNFSYPQMVAATRYLADPDCQFLAAGTDLALPLARDLTVPAFSAFLDTISRFTQREPTIVCKPALLLGEILKDVYKLVDPKRCLFIGDSLTHDVRFALGSGFRTLLVLSGNTSIDAMWEASAEEQPHYYADSITDLMKLYDNIRKSA